MSIMIGNDTATSGWITAPGQPDASAGPRGVGDTTDIREVLLMGGPEEAIAAALLRLEEASERNKETERRARESQFERSHEALEEKREAARKNKLAGIASGLLSSVTAALGTVGENIGGGPKGVVTAGQRGLKGAHDLLATTGGLVGDVMVGNAEEQRLLGERLDLLAQQDAERAQLADETGDAVDRSTDRARQALSSIAESRAAAQLASARSL